LAMLKVGAPATANANATKTDRFMVTVHFDR
jgi:hypothetical protein